ncbi:MAG: HAD superfamily hydrolase (TIGR01509 family) [Kiritimatiellia bacterium]|jgi:HAD superfamily hydrolase (TIGR01509 family)
MTIRAVIFDMDGVLVDSEPTWVASEIEVFGRHGVHLTPELCSQTRGMRVDAVARHWYARKPWKGAMVDDVAHEITNEVARRLRQRAEPLPGAKTAPALVRQMGLRCALASSSPMHIIDAVVDALNLREQLQELHSAEHHPQGKPHPAVYMAAAEALNVPPGECLAIEDSITGLISARAAGMRTLAIPDPDRYDDPRFSIAHYRLRSLEPLQGLLSELTTL